MNNSNIELDYAESLKRILQDGVLEHNRTGIDTMAVQHQYFLIPETDKKFPVLKGKKVYPKMALKELVWMLLGRTDVQWLHDHKVTYWDEWVLEDGTIGKSYGYQYRNFNGVDQMTELANALKNNPTSRRHIVSLWNVSDLPEMALPPCMFLYQFACVPTTDKAWKLDMHVLARSNDSFLGVPYDMMFDAWFLNLICLYMNRFSGSDYTYAVGDIHYTANNYHMYVNHDAAVKQYLINVQENKDNVITDNESRVVIEDSIFDNRDIKSFDDFLNVIEQNISTKSIRIECSNPTEFSYPTIKADIAV